MKKMDTHLFVSFNSLFV